jgi:membrane fusion protein (multidrug efflux system)
MPSLNRCVSCLALLLLALSPAACDTRPPAQLESPEARIAEVEVLLLESQPWVEAITSYGVIEAAEEIVIAVEFSGQIEAVHFEEGDRVQAGELLIELDSEKQSLRLSQARTTREETEATLAEAQTELKRRQELFRLGNVSRATVDKAQLAVKTARARYEDAIAAVQLAERELADCRITSPAGGLVEKRLANPGEAVIPGAALGLIQAVDAVRVVTYVTEKDINHLRLGSEASVSTPGVQGQLYNAHIESLGAKADPATGNFTVKLAIPNPGDLLRPGMTARVALQGVRHEEAIVVPDSALVDRDRRRVAYKVVKDRAIEVEPAVALSGGDRLRVLTGLQAGDRLIVGGLANVTDGTLVRASSE